MPKYTIMDVPLYRGKPLIKRQSDGLVARCKKGFLVPYGETGFYVAKSNVAAIQLDGLDWAKEEL